MIDENIVASKFFVVRRDTQIRECIRLMQDRNTSFVLIENKRGLLEGIFTLKDLLKNFKFLTSEIQLNKPVSVFMSRPVDTININQIHLAPKIMLKHGFRHLPVISSKDGESSQIIGVIDVESLLKLELKREQKNFKGSKEISVFSPNGGLLKLMKNSLKKYPLLVVDKMWASRLRSHEQMEHFVHAYDIFFFDLEDVKSLKFALSFSHEVRVAKKKMIALKAPGQFTSGEGAEILLKLSRNKRVRVFEKPINVHDLVFECLD